MAGGPGLSVGLGRLGLVCRLGRAGTNEREWGVVGGELRRGEAEGVVVRAGEEIGAGRRDVVWVGLSWQEVSSRLVGGGRGRAGMGGIVDWMGRTAPGRAGLSVGSGCGAEGGVGVSCGSCR